MIINEHAPKSFRNELFKIIMAHYQYIIVVWSVGHEIRHSGLTVSDMKNSHFSDGTWKTMIREVVSRKEVVAVRQKLYKSRGDNYHYKFYGKLACFFPMV